MEFGSLLSRMRHSGLRIFTQPIRHQLSRRLVWCYLGVLGAPQALEGQLRNQLVVGAGDPRGAAEITVCSQNLKNYGSRLIWQQREGVAGGLSYEEKEEGLVVRIIRGKCDIVAVQEVLGKTLEEAKAGADRLAKQLSRSSGRIFVARVAPGEDLISRVGFLFAKDAVDLVQEVSYSQVELPKLSKEDRPQFFGRAPFEVQFKSSKGRNEVQRLVTVVNFHLKSKVGGVQDAAGLEFETLRMQMAEAIRRIVATRHQSSLDLADSPLLLVGDRNSSFDSASAKILEGVLTLENFQEKGGCRMSKKGLPLCLVGTSLPAKFFSVFVGEDNHRNYPGTFLYKGKWEWLDDILMPQTSLHYAWRDFDSPYSYESGLINKPEGVSDHSLAFVRLNW